ncbi:transposase, partial [Escherichia coli]
MIKQGNEQHTPRRHRATEGPADRTAGCYRLSGEITGYAREISSLRALVAKLQRMLFGRSSEKSREKIEKKIARAETRITELQNRLGEAQLQLTSMAGETAPKTSDSPVRKALPATLPRDR